MKNKVSYRIRKLRESKDLKQKNVADELNITESAYSKIERGITDPSIGRLEQIAKILGVSIPYFFQETSETLAEDGTEKYGFATKIEVEDLNNNIRQIKQDISALKKEITGINAVIAKKKK